MFAGIQKLISWKVAGKAKNVSYTAFEAVVPKRAFVISLADSICVRNEKAGIFHLNFRRAGRTMTGRGQQI